MKYICMFLPAVVAVNYDRKKADDFYTLLVSYAKYCISINLFFLLILLLMGRSEAYFDYSGSIQFYFIYLLISTFLAVLFPRIANYCRKNFSFKIKREKHEKK